MYFTRFVRAAILAALIAMGPPALADTPVADPGFAFVDVDNDGLYSASNGDIGLASSPSVDINAMIQSGGGFSTLHKKGAYHPPAQPVSLVIPASQSFVLSGPLTLTATQNIIVHGQLTAASIVLAAGNAPPPVPAGQSRSALIRSTKGVTRCAGGSGTTQGSGTVDITGAVCTFDSDMSMTAGSDIVLTGAALMATDVLTLPGPPYTSTLEAAAGRDLIAGFDTYIQASTAIWVGSLIKLNGDQTLQIDRMWATCSDPEGEITTTAEDQATLSAPTYYAPGSVTVKSFNAGVDLTYGNVTGDTVYVKAGGDANLEGTSLLVSGAATVQAGGTALVSNSSAPAFIQAGSLSVKAGNSVAIYSAAVITSTGAVTLSATRGVASLSDAMMQAGGGLSVTGGAAVQAQQALLEINGYAKLTSSCGPVDADQSVMTLLTDALDTTYIKVQASGLVSIGGINWTAPAKITVKSTCSNIEAAQAAFHTPATTLTTGGAGIDVTGAVFDGTVTYSPRGVTVTGP